LSEVNGISLRIKIMNQTKTNSLFFKRKSMPRITKKYLLRRDMTGERWKELVFSHRSKSAYS